MSLANRTSAAMNELSVHAGTFEDIVSGCCYMTKQGLKVTLHEILGEGGFGKVFLGRSNGCDFAVKAVRYTSEYGREKIKNEIAYLACLSSSGFTPQFHGYTHLKDCYVLEMERMGLSLDAWTKLQIHGVPHSDIKSIGHQILQGVNYIHSMGIIHSDLKPENLCLVHGDRLIVKILDFGLAKTGPQLSQMAIGDLFGTMPYASPEMLLGLQLTSKLDIWSIGLILAETMTGARVFTETNRDNMIRAMHQTRLIPFAGRNSPYFTSSLEVYGPEAPPLVYTDLQALIVKYTVGYGWTNDKKQKFVSFLMKLLTPDSWLRPSSEEGLQGYPD